MTYTRGSNASDTEHHSQGGGRAPRAGFPHIGYQTAHASRNTITMTAAGEALPCVLRGGDTFGDKLPVQERGKVGDGSPRATLQGLRASSNAKLAQRKIIRGEAHSRTWHENRLSPKCDIGIRTGSRSASMYIFVRVHTTTLFLLLPFSRLYPRLLNKNWIHGVAVHNQSLISQEFKSRSNDKPIKMQSSHHGQTMRVQFRDVKKYTYSD